MASSVCIQLTHTNDGALRLMYIRRIILQNLKGFKDLDFRFGGPSGDEHYEGWTVITGDNGSGKSILLKAIAMAMAGPTTVRSLQPSFAGWIRSGFKEARIALEIISHNDVDSVETGRQHTRPFWAELDITSSGTSDPIIKTADRRRKSKKGPMLGPWSEQTKGWFAVGYGPFRRIRGASPEAQRLMSAHGKVARFATMFKEDATLQECEIWLRDLNYKKLENRKPESQLLDDVLDFLNSEFLQNNIRVSRVDSDGLWLEDAKGTVLNLADMSEGYRASLSMMVDIMRHLSDTYGGLSIQEDAEGNLYSNHVGVVLIDEADAHLHPLWQQRLGEWLTVRFPNIQFIVTTHSPHICQAASSHGIFHLPHPSSGHIPFQLNEIDVNKIRSSTADAVLLTPAFGLVSTRSPEARRKRAQYAALKAKKMGGRLSPKEQLTLDHLLEKYIRTDADYEAE